VFATLRDGASGHASPDGDRPGGRWPRTWLWLLWLYPAVLAVLVGMRIATRDPRPLSAWCEVPAQLAVLYLIVRLLVDSALPRQRAVAWRFLFVATVLDLVANIAWMEIAESRAVLYGSAADFGFVLNYVALVACIVYFYRACGGRLGTAQFWIDAATLTLGAGVSLLPFLLSPAVSGHASFVSLVTSLGYTGGLTAVAVTGSMLYMQITDWHAERAVGWLLIGVVVILLADLIVAAANIRGEYLLGGADVVCSVLVYSAFATAIYAEREPRPIEPAEVMPNLYGFLPVLSLFVGVAIVLGAEFNFVNFNMLLAASLSLLAAVLVVWRQFRVRLVIARLNERVAAQVAEARVSELVRSSADLLIVVGRGRRMTYLSPATEEILGVRPEQLLGIPVAELLGGQHAAAIEELLETMARRGEARAELEVQAQLGEEVKSLQLIATDQSRNELLEGIVLTVRDMSEQRSLERALLDVATRERHRLCGDIHEGLGQQLTGIVLYLKSMVGAVNRGGRIGAAEVDAVVDLVNGAIEQVRTLARGLSPLEVVHRSLGSALKVLTDDLERQFGFEVTLEARIVDASLTDLEADHLYRIVQEGLLNAARHSGCRAVALSVRVSADDLMVTIEDDGRGMPEAAGDGGGLGLRMMRYRARLLGASLKIETRPAGGARLVIAASRHAGAPGAGGLSA
jgi:PAS domain S-box-containing protein